MARHLRYWGKADPNYARSPRWHPLVYHCLDVAAVAAAWWDSNQVIQKVFRAAFGLSPTGTTSLRAWVLFFVALHDVGKFDVRFQLKAEDALREAWPDLDFADVDTSLAHGFDHGHWGFTWAVSECPEWANAENAAELRENWQPLIAAVTGHHGDLPQDRNDYVEYAAAQIVAHDRDARREAVSAFAELFLAPAGLSLSTSPPQCDAPAQSLLAGFCAVCDWIGSSIDSFPYRALEQHYYSRRYFADRLHDIASTRLLQRSGLISESCPYDGVRKLLEQHESPRSVQTIVDELPLVPGLTVVEAPTGTGKTEAALGYAWRLLDADLADSIVFALPTQATANAMLSRVERLASLIFGNANVVLAHGKSNLNREFHRLVGAGMRRTAQGEQEAAVQCSAWLASSRKRVFLGQIGVCTVDQVLLSVLPVRHKFVRGFGLNKSVLIVDEVHAYDAYMHGLLGEVLRRQKAVGGSAILLSATLPAEVRARILQAWQAQEAGAAPYPAVWHVPSDVASPLSVSEGQRPSEREVEIESRKLPGAFPDDETLASLVAAAEAGARVAVIVNLVDDAQRVARVLRGRTAIPIDLFHARYRFVDRQQKERNAINLYGRHASRNGGRVLVATQVVEQSVDLDFDWMVTQICPVDLLFQRLGRLHRHERQRPAGFEVPRCTVVSVEGEDFGLHKRVYGNTRILWRTERLLAASSRIPFPEAYRDWLERVYQPEDWSEEPDSIALDFDAFRALQRAREADARQLTTMSMSQFRDEDARVTSLTRDDEMSLSVLPVQRDGALLDGEVLDDCDGQVLPELLELNVVPAPSSWRGRLSGLDCDADGRVKMSMIREGTGTWVSEDGRFRYSTYFGLERVEDESA